jgi:regulator of protease activity HflC (stomatin/prohibitin superfamily)
MFWKTIRVSDAERVVVSVAGRFRAILKPGVYRLRAWPLRLDRIETETFSVFNAEFDSPIAGLLVKEQPDVVTENFVVVETTDEEVAVVYADNKVMCVVPPGKRVLYWNSPMEIRAERIAFAENPRLPERLARALARFGKEAGVLRATVDEGKTGLWYFENKLRETLAPGTYAFWLWAGASRVEQTELRLQTLEVNGQEVLSKDKATLRVNVSARYRVTDAVKAATTVKDATAHLYLLVQFAIRETFGKRTLEETLAEKVSIDAGIVDTIRKGMEAYGVMVEEIGVKDVILPGDLREIMNRVVEAEKAAQANLIRRREETAATRSLLNTARLMEENPILVRLKELETLEKLTEKVDRITIGNGLEGLLEQIKIAR